MTLCHDCFCLCRAITVNWKEISHGWDMYIRVIFYVCLHRIYFFLLVTDHWFLSGSFTSTFGVERMPLNPLPLGMILISPESIGIILPPHCLATWLLQRSVLQETRPKQVQGSTVKVSGKQNFPTLKPKKAWSSTEDHMSNPMMESTHPERQKETNEQELVS